MIKKILKHILALLLIAIVLLSATLTTVLLYKRGIFARNTLTSKTVIQEDQYPESIYDKYKQTYKRTPPKEYSGFFEETHTINNDLFYIAHPIETDTKNPPTIIIYNHGQLARITTDFSTYPMNNIREYANIFANNNYIFIAANQYGDTWGDSSAIDANNRAIEWAKETYPTAENINLIGFSMGGRAALNQALYNVDSIEAMALLTPSTGSTYWDGSTNYKILKDIPTKIWNGTDDLNIFPSHSKEFILNSSKSDWIIEYELTDGQTHYDMDTEKMEEILFFFENSNNTF